VPLVSLHLFLLVAIVIPASFKVFDFFILSGFRVFFSAADTGFNFFYYCPFGRSGEYLIF
jgi:hypothetical protein